MATIGTNCMDSEGELLNDVINETDSNLLTVPGINLESSDSCSVVDCRVLITSYSGARIAGQIHNFHIHLDVMARYLLGIATGMERTTANFVR
jgi:hypothetical protein